MIKAIMACTKTGGVGYNGSLPWANNKEDMKYFRDMTFGQVVVMGSKTWIDPEMPSPLPGRFNVVVTSNPEAHPGADDYITGDINEGLKNIAAKYDDRIIWVIGGAKLLEQAVHSIKHLHLTKIDTDARCDTFINLDMVKHNFNLRSTFQAETSDNVFEVWSK